MLEILFVVLTIVFTVTGYGFHQLGRHSYQLTKRNPNGLRVVTWNVGGAGGHDGRSLENQFLPHVANVLKRLDADTRELSMLRFYSQLSFKEIAKMRSEPIGTTLAKLHRGLKRLREFMEG